MSRKLFASVVLLASLSAPAISFAQAAQERKVEDIYDARLEGYPTLVTLPGGSSFTAWVMFVIFGGMCVGAMAKKANRSHLD